MLKVKIKKLKVIASCILLSVICYLLPAAVYSEGTVANTVIQNGGDSGTVNTADVAGDTVVQWVIGTSTSYATCPQVSLIVSTGYAIAALPTPADQTLTPGATAYYAYSVYNIGNATDTFTLAASTFAGQDWPVKIYQDDNRDGIHQDNETTEVTNTGPLANDATYYFHVAVIIPASAIDGTSTYVRLTVKDQNGAGTEDNWQVAGNDTRIDETTTICTAITLAMVKGSNVLTARPFTDTIVFTSTITSSGTGTAKNVIYQDKLPAECSYVTGSMYRRIWPGALEGPFTDANDSDPGTWDSANQLITINLGDLTAGTSAYIEFKVIVK